MGERVNLDGSMTTVTRQTSEGVDSSGAIDTIIGYTANSMIPRDVKGRLIFSGAEIIEADSDDCYAKQVLIKHERNKGKDTNYQVNYFIKIGVNGQIFNPWGMYSEGTQSDYAKTLGKPQWSFAKVTKRCFEFYINFLQSRNTAWLNNAERELR